MAPDRGYRDNDDGNDDRDVGEPSTSHAKLPTLKMHSGKDPSFAATASLYVAF